MYSLGVIYYKAHFHTTHFPNSIREKFDSYRVYAISTDIEPRLLRRPYSHIAGKTNVYCITPIPTHFDSLRAPVFY